MRLRFYTIVICIWFIQYFRPVTNWLGHKALVTVSEKECTNTSSNVEQYTFKITNVSMCFCWIVIYNAFVSKSELILQIIVLFYNQTKMLFCDKMWQNVILFNFLCFSFLVFECLVSFYLIAWTTLIFSEPICLHLWNLELVKITDTFQLDKK